MDLRPWKILGSKIAFENRWWKVMEEKVELPDGSVTEHYVNHVAGGAVVFALTEGGNLVVNRQYKHGARKVVTELAIGRLDGFEPMEEAKRELLEETGYGGGAWEPLAVYLSNPTSSTGRIHAFLARGVRKVAEPKLDPREIVEVSEVPLEEVAGMLERGEFSTHAAIATIFLALKRLGKLELKP